MAATAAAAASPQFSVVIPTRARAASLAECLARLAPGRQAEVAGGCEVIVADDGVAPASTEAQLARNFPWARWVAGPRRGPAANRNCGARLARGEWLVFTDDDCLPDARWLAAFAEAADAAPEIAVLEGRTSSGRPLTGLFEIAPVNETGGMLWSCNFAIRRAAFEQLGGFDENFPAPHLEDVDLRVRIGHAGWPVRFVSAAEVVHPPRALTPVWLQVRDHRSYFYFARKHGVSLRAAGLSGAAFWRGRLSALRGSRSMVEAGRFAGRCLLEAVLLVPMCAWWLVSSAGSRKTP
jgi:GT2 family glycosyltransferase